uniref:Uncharacterized protein n=1 Tax=Glossina pallidipes TaxID=7398 RepID=A0A1A9Z2V5_GLOPL
MKTSSLESTSKTLCFASTYCIHQRSLQLHLNNLRHSSYQIETKNFKNNFAKKNYDISKMRLVQQVGTWLGVFYQSVVSMSISLYFGHNVSRFLQLLYLVSSQYLSDHMLFQSRRQKHTNTDVETATIALVLRKMAEARAAVLKPMAHEADCTTCLCTSHHFSRSCAVPMLGFNSRKRTPAIFTPDHTGTELSPCSPIIQP